MKHRQHLNTVFIKLKRMLFLYSIILLSICTSCSSKKEIHYDYIVSALNLEARFYDPPKDAKSFYYNSNNLFYQTTDDCYSYRIDEHGNTESVKLPIPDSEFREIKYKEAQIVSTDSGSFYRLEKLFYPKDRNEAGLKKRMIKEREFYLEKYSKEGVLLFCKDIGLDIGYDTDCYYRITTDKEDNVYFANAEIIIVFDPDGSIAHKIPRESYRFIDILSSDNNIWFFWEDSSFRVYAARVTKDGKLTDERNCPGTWQYIAPLPEDKFLYTADGKLYLTDFRNNRIETLAQWSDLGISPEYISDIMTTKDGRLVVTLRHPDHEYSTISEIAVISEADESQTAEKEVLTLGVFYADNQLRDKIAKFNRSSKNIRINLKEYMDKNLERSDESLDYAKTINPLHLDIVSGKCPDILCLDYADMEDLAYQNVLEDLTPYINRGNEIGIPANVTSAYTLNNMLAGIPLYVQVRTIFLKDSDYSGEWTTDRFMEYLSEQRGAGADIPDAKSVLKYLLTCNLDSFVDFEAARCDFTSGKFENLLSFCRDISGSAGNTKTPKIFRIPDSVGDANWSDTEMIELYLSGLWDISALKQIFHSDNLNFAGYPHDGADSGYILEAVGGAYSISSFSKYKESAWEFIKCMAKEEQRTTVLLYFSHSGFPVDADSRREYYNYTPDIVYTFKNVRFAESKPEETEQLEAIVSSARMLSKKETTLLDIVLEEANDYITLNKPLHDVAESVQNRVNLYLIE